MSDHLVLERIEMLRSSADDAARTIRGVYFIFLLVGLYIAIIIGSTTDEQLLRESGIKLPLLGIELPIVRVYTIVPPLFVLLHFNLLLQFYLLSKKLHHLDEAIILLKGQASRREARDLIFPFPFSNLLIGRYGWLIGGLLRLMVWIPVVAFPTVVLLWAQVEFLPYHREVITWGSHRVSVFADLFLLWVFLPMIGRRDGRWRLWDPDDSWIKPTGAIWFAIGTALTLVMAWISLSVFMIPEEKIAWAESRPVIDYLFGEGEESREREANPFLRGFFHRNLALHGAILAREPPSPEMLAAYVDNGRTVDDAWRDHAKELDLHNRNLLFADFSLAQLINANLSNAILKGANLQGARLQGANLRNAELQGALLIGAWLQGADLGEARLEGADLSVARLKGASLNKAQLQGADLQAARLQGANLGFAELQGAVLTGARLQGADLRGAWLQGADLSFADLQGADLRFAFLGGANLQDAKLDFSDLRSVSFAVLTSPEWEMLMDSIEMSLPNKRTGPRFFSFQRNVLSRMTSGQSRLHTVLPDYNQDWEVLYGPLPKQVSHAAPLNLSGWLLKRLDKGAYGEKPALFLAGLACDDPVIAESMAKRATYLHSTPFVEFPEDRSFGSLLAANLLDDRTREKCRDGIGALPEETIDELKALHEENQD